MTSGSVSRGGRSWRLPTTTSQVSGLVPVPAPSPGHPGAGTPAEPRRGAARGLGDRL